MKKIAFIYIILAGITWGTSGIFVKYLSPYGFTSTQMTAIRCLISALSVGAFLIFRNRKAFRISKKELLLFIGSGASLSLTAMSYYFCMQSTSISTAAVLLYSAPVLVTVYSVLFLGEKLTRLKLTSIIFMVVGCGLVSGILGGLRFDLFGILIGIFSGIAYTAYNVLTKIQMRKGCEPLSATFFTFLFSAIIALAVSSPVDIFKNAASEPIKTIPLMIAIGIVTCVTPYVLYTIGMKHLPAGTASALGIIEPMSATLFSIILFNEELTAPATVGILLIILAVLMLSQTERS